MRLAIISDVHANLEALQATLQAISGQNVDRIVFLGDVVGYNADPADCVALIQEADALCVGGNHDRAVAGVITTEGFSTDAAALVEWTRTRLSADVLDFLAKLPLQTSVENHLVAVHGALLPHGGCELTRLNRKERRRTSFEALALHASGARVCAFGHMHRVEIYEFRDGVERVLSGDEITLRDDAYYLVNPGTVGQPRGANDRRATYLVFDTARQVLTVHRVAYDFALPIAKACRAGLLPFYATVPAPLQATLKWTAHTLGLHGFAKRVAAVRQRKRREATATRLDKH